MNGYLLSIIGTILLCSIITVLIPNGKTTGTVKGIAKLVCVLAIIAPILRFFKTGEFDWENAGNSSKTVIELDYDFIEYYSEARVKVAERSLEGLLKEEFGVETSITLAWEAESETLDRYYEWEKIRITRIYVKLQSEGGVSMEDLVEYLKQNYCSEVILE